jgi:hypothetical protein
MLADLGPSKIPRWGTKMVVIYHPEEYVEITPGDGWVNTDDRGDLLNPEYKRLSSIPGNENMSMIPKEELYKNKAYEKIEKSEGLKKLHGLILSTMREANEDYYSENKLDPYKLPQITGSMFRYI